MSAPITLQARVEDYLAERRRLGFALRSSALALRSFSNYVDRVGHAGPLTIEVMAEWARHDTFDHSTPATWARRLKRLRPFTRYLRQFEPCTEVPDEAVFGAPPGRLAPHIYREHEIVDLLAAARQLPPRGGLRPATYETLFGLIAVAGLRVSEAVALRDADVDLALGLLTIRQTKFAKSRQLPLHPSTVDALRCYRRRRDRFCQASPEMPFFIGTRGRRLGQALGLRQVDRVFSTLRNQLGWVNRGAHDHPRVHDLRHTFAVRRLLLWHEGGTDIDQAMLALSTYLGHAKITDTYWYLTGVPELMGLAGSRFEQFVLQNTGADDA